MRKLLFLLAGIGLLCAPVLAQQTGSISGTVSLEDGNPIPGVLVTATADNLPQARTSVSGASGNFRFPVLPPGDYALTFAMDGMGEQVVNLQVFLDQNSTVNVTMGPELSETLQVISSAALIDSSSAEIKATIAADVIDSLPVGQEYRDIVKLAPGVQYTEDTTRGPSVGGSGQDNVYLFDGVNISRPLFGTLSTEAASYDIDQVSFSRGGAKAVDFNRSGGITVNTISKSGTNEYHGLVSYQVQSESMTGSRDTPSDAEFERDRDWTTLSIGGPLIRDNLYFYTSYYHPTTDRTNRSNLYGPVPNSEADRDEFFGKLTTTPNDSLLVNASYRDSSNTETGLSVTSESRAGSTSEGSDVDQTIGIFEASWVVNDSSFVSFKFTDYEDQNSGRPDNLFNFDLLPGTNLNISNLETQGLVQVPQPVDGADAFNDFIGPLIERYGYLENGVRVGGGLIGGASTINDQDFTRQAFHLGYDVSIGKHDLHFGYHQSEEAELLSRTSNGWGFITVPGGRETTADGIPVFYEARFQQQSLLGEVPPINSEFETASFEINDTIKLDKFTINVGVLLSQDELFGQGLRANSANVSGFELCTTCKYLMKKVDFDEMIQPRVGVVYSPNGRDTIYANFSKYHPAASSLPRAASWARNLRSTLDAQFDENGTLVGIDPVRASSGKFFQEGIDPRFIDEYLIGYSREITSRWTGSARARYRRAGDFWEDTNNNARSRFNPPPNIPTTDYIPELGDYRAEVGGSSYVIAELDGAFTKYYEASAEADWRGSNAYFKGTYVWSHYYGNFDQDNTTTENDADIFVGSSFLADGAGRQIWDNRYGNLRGDRRHQLKMYGYYNFDWNGSLGAFAVFQSGQPWEIWDVEVYRALTGSSSDTSRYAEPAGSKTTSSHYQLDLNYTHNFGIGERYNIQLRTDVFNVLDRQTGYNIQNKKNSSGFGEARDFFDPRRFQVAVRFEF